MFIRDSRRSYKPYSYAELILITYSYLFGSPVGVTELIRIQKYPVGITDQNDTPLFPLIHYSGYYHISMGIPRPVLINKEDTTQ